MNQSLKLLTLSAAIALGLSACKKEEAVVAEPAKLSIDLAKLPPLPAFAVADLDTSVSACTDLNQFVNGKWLAANPVPGDRTSWGSFEMLAERSLATQRQIVEAAAGMKDAKGTHKLIGDLWATGMDEAAIEAAGIKPIQPFLDEIAALKAPADLPAYLRKTAAEGRMSLFGLGGESDFKDSSQVIAYAAPGGLGLPDKTYYSGDAHKAEREAYQAHIAATLKLAGATDADAAKQAAAILAIETALAKVSYSNEELSRDVSKYYNPVSIDAANKITPAFEWGAYFDANGIKRPAQFSLSNPTFFKTLDGMFASVPMADWQAYLRFHTIDGLAPYLSKAFADQNFAFYGKTLRGQQEQKERWKRVLDTVNDSAGEALGQLYVEVAFPAESKAQMEKLVGNLSAALKTRLEKLEWMTPETRAKALEKWASFTPKIGYPDKWRDWAGLSTGRDSYVGNILAAAKFNHAYEMAKIGKPKDRKDWGMTPQTVNAYYNPLMNEIVFPAAILQPPFFDAKADPALNYGGIGAVIGHEMLHGYDDQGSRFDAKGSFANWWQPSDAEGFKAKTNQLVAQFDGYEALPGKKVNGNLTLGENIADLGGLTVALDALRIELADKKVAEIEGYTQEQRFFMNWATVWRRNFTEKELAVRLVTDPHAPAKFRANGTPSNMDAFAAAFQCKAGDPMVRSGAQKIAIW
ncbi:peptidase [Arenimonas maotaiensis]|uniref:Peptidase n=1 Tax=Arenimonas maotaiensis TaxID=1446479 RepID=A0A917FI98_9GAMM|nr:peptidase [Arenimonas maotaiensis]